MKFRLPAPRLLPATIATMSVLLAVKCVGLVQAAAPDVARPAEVAPKPATAPHQPALPSGTPPERAPSEAERRLLLDLRQRRDQLDAREAALRTRETVLAAAEQKLEQRVAELKALQARLEQLDAARRQQDDASWAALVQLYEKMKPRDAARILDDTDMAVLVPLIDHMKERQASAILAAMHPERARDVTAALAAARPHHDTDSAK